MWVLFLHSNMTIRTVLLLFVQTSATNVQPKVKLSFFIWYSPFISFWKVYHQINNTCTDITIWSLCNKSRPLSLLSNLFININLFNSFVKEITILIVYSLYNYNWLVSHVELNKLTIHRKILNIFKNR